MGSEETGYPMISVYEDFTPDKSLKRFGSSIDWTFGALGIPTFSTELWDIFNAAGIKREDFYPLRNFDEEEMLKLLGWQDEKLDGDGFMPWTPFDHPQLGALEIGGWKRMYTYRNPPPAAYLEEMAAANCRFTLRHAAAAPRLRLRDLQAKAVDAGVYQISVVIDNTGFLPTNLSEQAVQMREAKPVMAELRGPNEMHFIHGQATQDLGHLAGRSSRPFVYSRFYDFPASNQSVRWTVRVGETPTRLTLSAGCPRAGRVQAEISISADGDVQIKPVIAASGRSAASVDC